MKIANCSSDKARKILNYQTKVTLDESLNKLIEYIRKNGTKQFVYEYGIEISSDITPKTWTEKRF